jgi:hypothetical protein
MRPGRQGARTSVWIHFPRLLAAQQYSCSTYVAVSRTAPKMAFAGPCWLSALTAGAISHSACSRRSSVKNFQLFLPSLERCQYCAINYRQPGLLSLLESADHTRSAMQSARRLRKTRPLFDPTGAVCSAVCAHSPREVCAQTSRSLQADNA